MLLVEEPHHLRRGVGSLGVGVGAGEASARPGVPEPVDRLQLHDGATAGVVVGGAGVGIPAGYLPPARRRLRGRRAHGGPVVGEQVGARSGG
jgi:hypothetical protein